jgi:4-amino-4-deoxy-L-arabinose transferase-like glycosyltransferase
LLSPQVILLLVIGLLISRGITRSELFFFGDETRHAMNGVFFRDFMVDRPLSHPLRYIYEYYAKYPAIALPHWPPLFSFLEGIFFLIFGISVGVSHAVVLMFALLAVYFWYRIAELAGSRWRALLSAFIFPLLPQTLTFESVSMVEIPGVAMCLGAIYFWRRWLETESARELWLLAGFAAGAMLTSQLSVFLVLFLGLDFFLLERRFHLLRRWQVWAALAASLVIVLPWYLFSFHVLVLSYQRVVRHGLGHSVALWSVLFYLRALPRQLGPVLLSLSAIGFAWTLFKGARRYRFFLLWVVSAYICFTLIQEKNSRHILIWIPPLVYFALLGVEALLPWKRWALAASAALALYTLVGALRFDRPRVNGVEEATRYVLAQPGSDILYYQGYLNGDFVFNVRRLDPQKRRMVATDKQVVVTNMVYARRPVLRTPKEVLNFFRTWGIRYAVVESKDPGPGFAPVHDLLRSDQFELLRTFPILSNDPFYAHDEISVYRYRGELNRSSEPVEIPMMTIRHNIFVDLNRLVGRPWPN